jgi:nitroreductase
MELQEAIYKRRTINHPFSQKEVSKDDLEKIISAANRAPSHFNSQPWDFILITEKETRKKIGEIAGDSMEKLISKGEFFKRYLKYFRFSKTEIESSKSGIHIDKIPFFLRPFIQFVLGDSGIPILNFLGVPKILASDQKKIVSTSPVLLAFLLKKEEYKPGEKSGIYSLISMGAALQNIWLTVTSLGMGLQFVSTPMEVKENWDKILDLLKIPETHELMAVYRLGYIDEKQSRNTIDWVSDERRNFEDLVSFNYFGGKEKID